MLMLLSKPQKQLLSLLKSTGGLREGQARQLLEMEYGSLHWDPLVHQLIVCGAARRFGEYIALPGPFLPDESFIRSLDVMLLLAPKGLSAYHKAAPPFSLTFFREKEDKLWRYDVCSVKAGMEGILASELEAINTKYRTIVFLLEDLQQRQYLNIPCSHCFVQYGSGNYRFYK